MTSTGCAHPEGLCSPRSSRLRPISPGFTNLLTAQIIAIPFAIVLIWYQVRSGRKLGDQVLRCLEIATKFPEGSDERDEWLREARRKGGHELARSRRSPWRRPRIWVPAVVVVGWTYGRLEGFPFTLTQVTTGFQSKVLGYYEKSFAPDLAWWEYRIVMTLDLLALPSFAVFFAVFFGSFVADAALAAKPYLLRGRRRHY